jgi:hypothetical protein
MRLARHAGHGVGMGGRWGAPGGFFADADFDYEARIVLGATASRIGDAVADPGVVDVSAGWTAHLPPAPLNLLNSGQKDAFNAAVAQSSASASPEAARTLAFRGKPYGRTDSLDLLTEVQRYQVRDVVGQISTPMLTLDPVGEQFFPGQSRQLHDLLPGEKRIIEFTQAQGADFHCQPTGRQLTDTQMLDWLAERLPAWRAGRCLAGQTNRGGSQA